MQLSKEAKNTRLLYMKKYREDNKERIANSNREWQQNNPEKVKAMNERYWERKGKELKGFL